MPGVFSAINTRLQGNLVHKNLRTLAADLPDGDVVNQEGWVDSIIIPNTSVFIKGKYDLLIKASDGSNILVDLKISQPHEDKIEKYKTQLMAYKYAMEHPKIGQIIHISRAGLLIFYPDTVSFKNGLARLDFPPRWLEIPIDNDSFLHFAKEVDQLLSGPRPDENPKCKWCQYRHSGELFTHESKIEQYDLPF